LTENTVIVSFGNFKHLYPGSSGVLVPDIQARLVAPDGLEVTAYDTPGELFLKGPSVMKGYHGEIEATTGAFDSDGWLRTGDVVMFKKAPDGAEHLFVVDRLKDVMKVKVKLTTDWGSPCAAVFLTGVAGFASWNY
jgi:long-subunit acyl-CoA synthetase (AMP-forming)